MYTVYACARVIIIESVPSDVLNKGGPSQYPEEAAALAFFRVPRISTSNCVTVTKLTLWPIHTCS